MDHPVVFTDILRSRLSGIITSIARFLLRLGLTANAVTLLGVVGHLIAAVLVATGNMTWGGLALILFAPLDFLDGTMARLQGQPTLFGSFLDSVTDRYAEFILWAGLLVYYLRQNDTLTCVLIFAAAAGSTLVPYIRAKAESLGITIKIGILSRVERYLILVPALIFGLAVWAIWIIAILANITAVQRIVYFRKVAG